MKIKGYRFLNQLGLTVVLIAIVATSFAGCSTENNISSDNTLSSGTTASGSSSEITSSDALSEESSEADSSDSSSSEDELSQIIGSEKPTEKPQPKPEPEPQEQPREKLKLITPDGDDQAYHPSVVSFAGGWNGYKYWIAFTPYPNADATKENPTINASNDLVNWSVPTGLKNPIDKPEVSDSKHYNSDTHLIYNPQENRLELFWRYVADAPDGSCGPVTIYRSESYDGVTWSPKSVFLYSDARDKRDYISPSIMLKNGGYRIWYVDCDRKVYYAEVTDGVMSEPTLCPVSYEKEYQSWHIDVTYNVEKAVFEMVVCAFRNWSERQIMSLYYSQSADGINWSVAKEILKPSTVKNTWDSQGLYRACLLYENGNYILFYSAHGPSKADVGVGMLKGQDIYNLKSSY